MRITTYMDYLKFKRVLESLEKKVNKSSNDLKGIKELRQSITTYESLKAIKNK